MVVFLSWLWSCDRKTNYGLDSIAIARFNNIFISEGFNLLYYSYAPSIMVVEVQWPHQSKLSETRKTEVPSGSELKSWKIGNVSSDCTQVIRVRDCVGHIYTLITGRGEKGYQREPDENLRLRNLPQPTNSAANSSSCSC